MKKLSVWLAGLVLVSLGFAGNAAAEERVAALQIDIASNVEARIRSDIESATTAAFADVKGWTLVSADTVRRQLKPVVRDCFTEDCLKNAGESLGLRTGFSVKMTGEAQIYEWTLTLYDLRTGSPLNLIKGTCELCGQAEVSKGYTRSLTSLLQATTVPDTIVEGSQAGAVGEMDGEVRLRISVVPVDTDIYLGGVLVGQGDSTIPVGSGRHELRFAREGYRGLQEAILVNENSPKSILLRVHLSETPPAPQLVQGGGDGAVDRLGEDRKLWGWIGVGSGAALLTTGIILASMDGDSTCSDRPYARCPEVRATAGGAVVTSLLGGALLASGAGLLTWEWLSGHGGGAAPAGDDGKGVEDVGDVGSAVRRSVGISPAAGLDGVGLQVFGRF